MRQTTPAEKVRIEHNTVQETLVIPLYARKLCTERFSNLFRDEKALELIGRLDYDFTALEKQAKSAAHQFGALEVAMRETDLMIELHDYLKTHPKATLVNLGCGLDQTAENVDNGLCRIVNVDLPDVIAVRKELLPERERVQNLGWDLNDLAWLNAIDNSNGVCLIAAGVFYYFKTDDLKKLFPAMAKHFPGGRLVFNTANRRAVKIMLKTWVKDAGVTSISDFFAVNSLKELSWMERATITGRGYMLGYHDLKDPSVPGLFRLMAKLGDTFMKMRIIRMDFDRET